MPTINGRLQIRAGTSAEWSTANPVLLAAELGFETDTGRLRVGDGMTQFTSLPYVQLSALSYLPADTTLPALNMMRVKSDASGVEFRAPWQVRESDLGISGPGGITVATIANLDTQSKGGTFFADSTATGLPLAEASVVIHHPADTSARSVQEAIGLTSGRRFWRRETSAGVWTAWSEVASSAAGEVAFFAMPTAPAGWLKANGAAVSRTAYAALFSAIGTIHGSGDGSTTFNLPDLRGEFLRGWDDGRGVDSGRVFATAQTDGNKAHSHALNDPAHSHSVPYGNTTPGTQNNFVRSAGAQVGAIESSVVGTNMSIQSAGGTEARPRNVALLACIRF